MSKRFLCCLCAAILALPLLACASDTSPGEPSDNPPPPPTRTPTGLRHAPNTGVYPMSNEISEEEAAKLVRPAEDGSDESESGTAEDEEPEPSN